MSAETPMPETSKRMRSRKRELGRRSRRPICYETLRNGGERIRLAEDIDPDYSDSIEVNVPDGHVYDDTPPALPLPGSGEQYDECGEDIPLLYCEDCGSPRWVGRTCRRSRCPRCWQSWVFQRAVEAVTAVDSTRKAMYDRTAGNVYNHHVVISPPDSIAFDSDDPVSKLFDAVKNLLGHVNADAGYLVYHPYRIKEEYRGDILGHESGDGEMQWKDVLALPPGERDEYLVHSPHVHAFVSSGFVGEWGSYDKTGFVIHRIADETGASLGDMDALAAAVAYSLSHAGIQYDAKNDTHRVTARFFGETANIGRPEWVRDRAETAMRDVAGQVLGVSFRRDGCQRPVKAARDAVTDVSTDGSSETLAGPNAFTGESDGHDHAAGDRETCGGRLVGIWRAPDALENDEWYESIGDRADDLQAAHDKWVRVGKPVPGDFADDFDPPPG